MKTNDQPTLKHPLITPEHLGRKALHYIRQSSAEQVEKNTGSQAFQRNQVELARAYGWPDHLIEVIDEDLGKSGSTVDRRTGWQRMLRERLPPTGSARSFRSTFLGWAARCCQSRSYEF